MKFFFTTPFPCPLNSSCLVGKHRRVVWQILLIAPCRRIIPANSCPFLTFVRVLFIFNSSFRSFLVHSHADHHLDYSMLTYIDRTCSSRSVGVHLDAFNREDTWLSTLYTCSNCRWTRYRGHKIGVCI